MDISHRHDQRESAPESNSPQHGHDRPRLASFTRRSDMYRRSDVLQRLGFKSVGRGIFEISENPIQDPSTTSMATASRQTETERSPPPQLPVLSEGNEDSSHFAPPRPDMQREASLDDSFTLQIAPGEDILEASERSAAESATSTRSGRRSRGNRLVFLNGNGSIQLGASTTRIGRSGNGSSRGLAFLPREDSRRSRRNLGPRSQSTLFYR